VQIPDHIAQRGGVRRMVSESSTVLLLAVTTAVTQWQLGALRS
jgi:hypothetical protein